MGRVLGGDAVVPGARGVSSIDLSLPVHRRDFANHDRGWRDFRYVYPVLSRRSRGLSIGINLNPDQACNFDCIYCQVDRTTPSRVRDVELDVLRRELTSMVTAAHDGSIFAEPEFADTPGPFRRLNDLAFSGDGEPTTCPEFAECVALAAEVKGTHASADVQLILITDACYLMRPAVVAGLEIMDRHHGRIWAKLDAGTEQYYRLINRPNYPLTHVVESITHAARVRPVTIQSLFMRVHDVPPSGEEIGAYLDRLNEIVAAGGRIGNVQIYTVARRPAQTYVTPLTDEEVDGLALRVGAETSLAVERFYAPRQGASD